MLREADVERLSNRYDNFIEEFSAILRRQAPGRVVQGSGAG